MSTRSLRDHSKQLEAFAASATARASSQPDDWLLAITAKNQRDSADEARLDAVREEAAQRGELLEWRFVGQRLNQGALPLDFLSKLAAPLNNLLVRSAYFSRTHTEPMYGAADELSREIGLSLIGVAPGSTRLFISGSATPDTTGDSAFWDGVSSVIDVLSNSANFEQFFDRLDDIGERAAEALHQTLKAIEGEECSMQLTWHGSGGFRTVEATFDRVVQMRTLLDGFSDSEERQERLSGRVSLLSVKGRMQVEMDDGSKATVRFKPRTQAALVAGLTLNAQVQLDVAVRVTHDPISDHDVKRYSLLGLDAPLLRG